MANYLHAALFISFCAVLCCAAMETSLRGDTLLTENTEAIEAQLLSTASTVGKNEKVLKYLFPQVWYAPRVKTFTENLYDKSKRCEWTNKAGDAPTLKGGRSTCYTSTSRDINGNMMGPRRAAYMESHLVPRIVSDLSGLTLMKRVDDAPKPFNFSNVDVCKHITVPQTHQTNGVEQTDIVVYVTAAPIDTDTFNPIRLWVHRCETASDQPLVLVVNFNMDGIQKDSMESKIFPEIQKVLALDACNDGKAIIALDDDGKTTGLNGKCVKVSCGDTQEERRLEVKDGAQWKECPSDNRIPLVKDPKSAGCPFIAEFCSGEVEKVVTPTKSITHSLSPTVMEGKAQTGSQEMDKKGRGGSISADSEATSEPVTEELKEGTQQASKSGVKDEGNRNVTDISNMLFSLTWAFVFAIFVFTLHA